MIDLALHRISALLRSSKISGSQPFPWYPIHVAGTNGKGSTCNYIAALLRASKKVRVGQFTSPHLIDKWDCIQIDGRPVDEQLFRDVEKQVEERNEKGGIGATEFERLTATAFDIFGTELAPKEGIPGVGVIEVGLGGRLDATNIIQNPLVTVVTHIGLDHQNLLGNTLAEIAREKAGILKPDAEAVIDGYNNKPAIVSEIKQVGQAVCAGRIHVPVSLPRIRFEHRRQWPGGRMREFARFYDSTKLRRHERGNIACAYEAVKVACRKLEALHGVPAWSLAPALMDTHVPGRQQVVDVTPLLEPGAKAPSRVLLDGAHNADSAAALSVTVNVQLRLELWGDGATDKMMHIYSDMRTKDFGPPVTWLLALSQGKDVSKIFETILNKGDRIVATEFGPVDGMPWVKPMPVADVEAAARATGTETGSWEAQPDVLQAIRTASRLADGKPLIIAGSLYLVSDVLRLLRDASPLLGVDSSSKSVEA